MASNHKEPTRPRPTTENLGLAAGLNYPTNPDPRPPKMRIPVPQVILLLAALFGAADAGSGHWKRLRRMCCEWPDNNVCRVGLERWRICDEAWRQGKSMAGCGDFRQNSDFSRVACRPGIDGPPDWKDEEKPRP
ncbi:uncharacterized protein LY79DRAFT_665319 [Colletotrichum navitas]|uniref:Uncharacterized protein n=1 Tax=Colletotrichum navitas TaxID=681940 RepID=A0AAD8VCM1_9PEZI|nr:uncharacterized protein LY79DRAFT_665319 [Colletotrichum navitas]KAK1599690.1 hypothetical protein LY79DRAFT_665319 [Colletotrichum navitas]